MKFIFIFLLGILISCTTNQAKFKRLDKFLSYQILELGDGEKPNKNEVILLRMTIKSLDGDTLHFVPDYTYYLPIQNHYLDTVWQKFEIGDKLRLRIRKNKLTGYLNFYHLQENNDEEVIMEVKLLASVQKSKMNQLIKEQLSLRETREFEAIQTYLKKTKLNFEELNGIYRFQDKFTEGERIKYGSKVSIHYKGRFLNGYTFDDTYKKEITPTFTFGQEYQLLEGIYKGISGMRMGETVKLILPSHRAFGGDGSLAAIVPPYTAVMYEINIVKVIN